MEMQHSGEATGGPRAGRATWVGLFVSLFGILIIRSAAGWIAPHPGPTAVLLRELVTLGTAAGLLLLVRYWEKRPLTSIGIGTSALGTSSFRPVRGSRVRSGAANELRRRRAGGSI
jgi:hypothetical protein